MIGMAIIVAIGIAAIFVIAIGYVASYAASEARILAEHRTLLRTHERIQQHFDPRHYGRQFPRYAHPHQFPQYQLEFQPELDDDTPIIVMFQNSRPFRSPNGRIMWTYADSPQGQSLSNRSGHALLPSGVSPVWTDPRSVRMNIATNPRWGIVPMESTSRNTYKVRRIS